MAYEKNMINNLIILYKPIKFGLFNPYLFIIEYQDFHTVKLLIKNNNTTNTLEIMCSGYVIIKKINSVNANPKIAKGPKIKLKTGSIII